MLELGITSTTFAVMVAVIVPFLDVSPLPAKLDVELPEAEGLNFVAGYNFFKRGKFCMPKSVFAPNRSLPILCAGITAVICRCRIRSGYILSDQDGQKVIDPSCFPVFIK